MLSRDEFAGICLTQNFFKQNIPPGISWNPDTAPALLTGLRNTLGLSLLNAICRNPYSWPVWMLSSEVLIGCVASLVGGRRKPSRKQSGITKMVITPSGDSLANTANLQMMEKPGGLIRRALGVIHRNMGDHFFALYF
ncbi:MAG: hypothetical protein IJ174_07155 [Clostridia bacterium]|nr:hypothetical protein [Clostridia bacterium]